MTAEDIYRAYPRHVGKLAALKAIQKAIKRGELSPEALLLAAKSFAASPAGRKGEFTPHPSTWFNQGRYLDDPKEWGKRQPETEAQHRGWWAGFQSEADYDAYVEDSLSGLSGKSSIM